MNKFVASICLVVASGATICAANAQQRARLPLGPDGLTQKVTEARLAPGLTLTYVVRGQSNPQDGYAVDVPFNTDQATVSATAAALTAAGFNPQVINIKPPQDATQGFFGAVVRVGVYATQALADSMVRTLALKNFTNITTDYTGFNGFQTTTGPWVINIVNLDPARFQGTIGPVRSNVPEGREITSSIAQRTNALVATNGGYFVIGIADGTPGAPVGISAIHGRVYHEATVGRSSFGFLSNGQSLIEQFKTAIYAHDGLKAEEQAFGENRRPGIQRDCGGPEEELPSNQPRQDFNCTLPDDLVLFTPLFGPTTDAGTATIEAVLDAENRVVSTSDGGNITIPPHGSVLAALGSKAKWLRKYANPGSRLFVTRGVVTGSGQPLNPQLDFNLVNGGPHLVVNGRVNIDATAEGFAYALPGNSNEYYGFGLSRNPRTLAGRTTDGHLLLVTVDGRQPGYSVGLSFDESANLMVALGADQAINLDGGGSTTIAVGGQLFNQPSDATGERPVGEAIVIKP